MRAPERLEGLRVVATPDALDHAWFEGDVTVLRVEGRNNPRPTVWSTRPYGRFGATFTTELQPGTPLPLSWTYVIALGARDTAWCQSMAAAVLRQ